MIDVVSAVIIRDGRILLTQRRADQDFPMRWECPGGGVEPDETHAQAIDRELDEEIGATRTETQTLIATEEFESPVSRPDRARVRCHFYHVIAIGDLLPGEGQPGIGWFTASEMRGLGLTPGNERVCDRLRDFMFDLAGREVRS